MQTTRRDFLKASSAIAAAFGLRISGDLGAEEAAKLPTVVWLQAQGCSGCSVSLLNTIYYMTADKLLQKTVSLKYHPTLMAGAGSTAVGAAQAARNTAGYILVVEGAIPTAAEGRYCHLWPGLTALEGVRQFHQKARFTVAVGTCAAFGGVPGGAPNPTGAKPLSTVLNTNKVINVPGCPAHPDWIVGTIAALIESQAPPTVDSMGRPVNFFGRSIHSNCPFQGRGCRRSIGCKGRSTRADCSRRRWNSGAANTPGFSWCLSAGSPCLGCTEPTFPDGMSPFNGRDNRGGRGRGPGGEE